MGKALDKKNQDQNNASNTDNNSAEQQTDANDASKTEPENVFKNEKKADKEMSKKMKKKKHEKAKKSEKEKTNPMALKDIREIKAETKWNQEYHQLSNYEIPNSKKALNDSLINLNKIADYLDENYLKVLSNLAFKN